MSISPRSNSSAASGFSKSAPLDHQSCSLTGPEAFVFCLPPAPSQSFPLKIQAVFYPKVSTKTDFLQKHHLPFNHSIIWFLGSQGVCGLILNAKHLKESAKNIVSMWHSVRSPSQHGEQRRLKTSSTFSGRWVYPTVLQDLLPVLRHNTSAAVTSPWHSNKLKGCGHMHSPKY